MKKGYARTKDGTIERTEFQVNENEYFTKSGLPLYPTGKIVTLKGWDHEKAEEHSLEHNDKAGDYIIP